MDFKALVTAQLNTNNAETELKNLCKDRDINLKVNLNDNVVFKSIQKQLNSISKQSIKLNTDKSTINEAKSDFQMLKNLANEIGQKKIKLAGLDDTKNVNQIKELRTQIGHLESDYKILKQTFNSSLNEKQIGQLEQIFGRTSDKISEITAKAKDLKSVSSVVSKIDEVSTKLKEFQITDTSKFENASAYQKMTNYIKDAENAMSRFNAEKEKGENANFNVLTKEMKEVESATKKAETQYKNLYTQINKLDGITASNKAFSWLSNNDKVYKDENLSSAIENIANQLKDVTYQGEYDSLKRELNSYITQAQASGLSGKSGISMFKQSFAAIAQFTGIYGLLQNVVEEIPRLMAQAVIDIDDSITELRKVSDASESSISEYFDEATESAKKYGQTISDVIASTADWSRLGYSLKEAKQLSDVTTLYQNVGDNMTQESASESLVSTLQGFKLNADQAQHIVDAFNEVGNNFAIGSDGIGEALQRSASSMYAAGNTMEETIGLITATNEVVQDPASVGTAFKTISMRIRGAKTELEEAGLETDGMVESTAKLREEIMALSGVDIMKDKNTFKSTYEILGQLADKWQDLTDIQQASITELIAGKRQGNIISALMNNFNTAREATETAMNSDGSALKENEKYMDSISGKIGKFKAQFQEFSSATLDSEVFKGVVDSGTALLNVLTEIISVGNGIPALLTTIGGISFFKHLD